MLLRNRLSVGMSFRAASVCITAISIPALRKKKKAAPEAEQPAEEQPAEVLPCRCYEILGIERYRPKELKRRYKGQGVEIMKRDTRLSVEEVRRSIGATAGSQHLLAVTSIAGENFVIELKQI